MNRYFAHNRCPDCGGGLVDGGPACPVCGLVLVGPTAHELSMTLQHADRLLAELRASPKRPDVTEPRPVRVPRMPAVSVPIVLLGLGGACLVIAAVVFVAVAWSDLSLGARTAILGGITALAGAATVVLMRRGLRMTAETFSVLTVALLVIDMVAGRVTDAPLLGRIAADQVDWLAGVTLLAGGLGWALVALRSGVKQLYGVQGLAVAGGFLVCAALLEDSPLDLSWTAALLVPVLAAAAWVARRTDLAVVMVGAVVAAELAWLLLAVDGLWHAVGGTTLVQMWAEGEGVRLLLAAAFAATAVAWKRPVPPAAARVVAACAALAAVVLLGLIPLVLDEGIGGGNVFDAHEVVVVSGVAAALAMLRPGRLTLLQPWRFAAVTVAALVALLPGLVLTASLGSGLDRVEQASIWSRTATAALPHVRPEWEVSWALPLAGAAVAIVAARVVASLMSGRVELALFAGAGLAAGGAAAVLLTDWPVLVVGALLSAGAAGVFGVAVRRADHRLLLGACVLSAAALAVAATSRDASAVLFGANAVVLVATALQTAHRYAAPALAGAGVLAGLVSAGAVAARVDVGQLGTGVLLVGSAGVATLLVQLPSAAVRRTRTGAEVAGGLGAMAGLALLDDLSWLAVGLTLAGAVAVAVGLLTTDRGPARWVGGVLLAAATWARMIDLDVDTVELYTVPSALVLTALGAHRLWRTAEASSWTTVLPGLGLGVLPSLWVALDEPTSLRALLVGLVGLGVLAVGVLYRLGAPLVLGAGTVALIAFVNLAPYSHAVPRWVLIGLAGVALIGCGITWESRLHDLATARRYVVGLH